MLLERMLPLDLRPVVLGTRQAGLVTVDVINGFATVGAGPLAPSMPDPWIEDMVAENSRLARLFLDQDRPIAVFLDTHTPGHSEPPYPPHCEIDSGQENLVPALAWLEGHATLIRKDCINGFIGAIDLVSGRNRIVDWLNLHRLESVVVAGICTDICVMDFVLTLLSARNHGLVPTVREVIVHEPGCVTYNLSPETAMERHMPASAVHPQAMTHHVALYLMAARGAILASTLIGG